MIRGNKRVEGDEVGGDKFVVQQAIGETWVDRLLERQQERMESLSIRLGRSEAENEGLRELVKAGLARLQQRANSGDIAAKAAIESGDATKMKNALQVVAAQKEEPLRRAASDFVDLQREVAAMAYLAGDVETVRKSQQKTRGQPIAQLQVLEEYEVAILVYLAATVRHEVGKSWPEVRSEVARCGFEELAAVLGVDSLLQRQLIEEYTLCDEEHGHEYSAFRCNRNGLDWLSRNRGALKLKSDPVDSGRFAADMRGDEIPF